jgi:hypothetical protein
VDLVEVDPVGAETGEGRIASRSHDVGMGAFHGAELGGDDDAVAPGPESATEELLAQRPAVDVRGVEQRDARVERRVHDGGAALLVDAHPEVVAAEPHGRDVQ